MGKTKTTVLGETPKEVKKEAKANKKIKIAGLKGGERIMAVEGGPVKKSEDKDKKTTQKGKKGTKVRGKNYKEAKTKINKQKLYSLDEAIKLAQEISYSKFKSALELHLVLKKDFSGKLVLPHPTGSQKKVEVASEATIEKLTKGNIDFDILLSTPEMMPQLVPFAKILGPKGLMPNPKNGTLIKDQEAAKNFAADALNLKTQKDMPLINLKVGKIDQPTSQLKENIEAVIKTIGNVRITKAYLSTTMSPSVKLAV